MIDIEGCNSKFEFTGAFYNPEDDFGAPPPYVGLTVKTGNYSPVHLELPVSDLDANKLKKHCTALEFDDAKSKKLVRKRLLEELDGGLQNGHITKGYYFEQGGSVILASGETCFLCGGELISLHQFPYIVNAGNRNLSLLDDCNFSIHTVVSILRKAPYQALMVLAFVVQTVIRSLLLASGLPMQSVLYIYGNQGCGKTTLAQRVAGIVQKENKPFGVVQAGSTLASVNAIMSQLRDLPLIIDDLCFSGSKRVVQKRVDLVGALIRQGTGEIPIIKKVGNTTVNLPCESGLIFTAEFPIDNLSDLTRFIIVPLKAPLNLPAGLFPGLIGATVRSYLQWLTKKTEDKIGNIIMAEGNCVLPEPKMDVRVSRNYATLNAVFLSLLDFFRSKTTLDDFLLMCNYYDKIQLIFENGLQEALRYHMNLIQKCQDKIPVGNLFYCIYQGYQQGEFDLTVKLKKLPEHDGIVWYDDLCLKQQALLAFVHRQPGYQDWSSWKIINTLATENALVLQEEDGYTVHLDKGSPRVYRLRLDILEKNAEKYM